jgi:hypothetical protein
LIILSAAVYLPELSTGYQDTFEQKNFQDFSKKIQKCHGIRNFYVVVFGKLLFENKLKMPISGRILSPSVEIMPYRMRRAYL